MAMKGLYKAFFDTHPIELDHFIIQEPDEVPAKNVNININVSSIRGETGPMAVSSQMSVRTLKFFYADLEALHHNTNNSCSMASG